MISIIIPTFNAAGLLPELLSSLRNQEGNGCDIIVIDSTSTDNTVEIAQSFRAMVLSVSRSDFDHGGTRSRAAKHAAGEYLVFLSQDSLPVAPTAIQTLIDSFKDDNVAAVYGRQIPASDASVFASHLRQFNYPETSRTYQVDDKLRYGIKAAFLSNSFAAYRKADLEAIGYFKEGLIFGEDMHAAARLLLRGKKICYCAESCVYHSHNYTIRQDFQRYFDMGVFHKSEKWLLREFGEPKKQGIDYLCSELSFLCSQKKYHLFLAAFLRLFLKYTGYKIGRHHNLLPIRLNQKLSANHLWWERHSRTAE